ncbi:MAG: NUDIX domain-containing protein [Hyphomicrobiales bacterium]|nr:NUDIX domain-containing protein [Hyphomicrobiales bacterium]
MRDGGTRNRNGTTLVDRAWRLALRAAYPLLVWFEDRTGRRQPAAVVAVWHGGRLLVVRHSYRTGDELPGGALRRGETPRAAAARELREETGIAADPADLVPFATMGVQPGVVLKTIYEYRPRHRPTLRIDNREIVEAVFLDPDEIGDPTSVLRRYLKSAR